MITAWMRTKSYIEILIDDAVRSVVLAEGQWPELDEETTLRVYMTKEIKRSVVVKEGDMMTKKDLQKYPAEAARATRDESLGWIRNKCYEIATLKEASNVLTSRYVAKWKRVDGKWIISMRLYLRGFQDMEAFDVEALAGTASRHSQRLLASEAACHDDWIIASLDVGGAFLKGLTYAKLAEATGEPERIVYSTIP